MDKISGISGPPPASGPQKPEKVKNDLFRQNLEAARAKWPASGTPAAGPSALGEVRPPVIPAVAGVSAGIVDKTESLLEMLEIYTRNMEDPKKTLKDIEPLIDSIQKEASSLVAEADRKMPEDTVLKGIVNEFAVAANVEYLKFYRGDYNS